MIDVFEFIFEDNIDYDHSLDEFIFRRDVYYFPWNLKNVKNMKKLFYNAINFTGLEGYDKKIYVLGCIKCN